MLFLESYSVWSFNSQDRGEHQQNKTKKKKDSENGVETKQLGIQHRTVHGILEPCVRILSIVSIHTHRKKKSVFNCEMSILYQSWECTAASSHSE